MHKKLLIIQHENDVPAGTTLDWARLNNYEVEYWYPAEESPAPAFDDKYAAYVICGGSMDTFEEEKFPWLQTEKKFIRGLIDRNKKIFGVCLGSQLIAEIMGGKVFVHPGWEVGFAPVKTTEGKILQAFHWHHCTFDLPPGAELIATNDFCKNQAYKLGPNIIATQFHPEATEDWIKECAEEVGPQHQGTVQNKEQMLASMNLQKPLQDWYFSQLDKLFNS